MAKQCPNCVHVNLKIADRKGVEIDYCPECSGVWLDCGELNKIIERSANAKNPNKSKILKSHTASNGKTAVKAVDTVFDIFEFFSGE